MEDLTELKNIWLSAKVEALPDAEEAVKTIKRYRLRIILKKGGSVLILVLMTVLMLYVVFYGPKSLSTRIGEAGILTGIFILLISNTNSLKRAFNQLNHTNREFIEYLQQAMRGRLFFYKRVQPIIFPIMSMSLFLYVYEFVRENPILMLVVYSLLIIYAAVLWCIIRKRVFRKRIEKLKKTIEKLEALTK